MSYTYLVVPVPEPDVPEPDVPDPIPESVPEVLVWLWDLRVLDFLVDEPIPDPFVVLEPSVDWLELDDPLEPDPIPEPLVLPVPLELPVPELSVPMVPGVVVVEPGVVVVLPGEVDEPGLLIPGELGCVVDPGVEVPVLPDVPGDVGEVV